MVVLSTIFILSREDSRLVRVRLTLRASEERLKDSDYHREKA
jgi:hypothetical protein